MLVVLALILLFFWRFGFSKETKNVRIDSANFQVEIAKTDAQRYEGLSGRKNLCPNCGMLFEFEKTGSYSFTMRGMELMSFTK